MVMLTHLQKDVKQYFDPEKAKFLSRFFKTGKGEYGENDVFYGLTVPQSRNLAVKYKDLSLSDVNVLLTSKIHEERLIALLILVHNFKRGDEEQQKDIYDFYLSNTKYINNWDLVDLSADKIMGEYLYKQDRDDSLKTLVTLAHSKSLWERRISMMTTFAFIKQGESDLTFYIADMLLHDKHDLIQKAVGWMLREVGKRVSQEKEESFLKTSYKTMPRTALRYAIERFSEETRGKYLAGKV